MGLTTLEEKVFEMHLENKDSLEAFKLLLKRKEYDRLVSIVSENELDGKTHDYFKEVIPSLISNKRFGVVDALKSKGVGISTDSALKLYQSLRYSDGFIDDLETLINLTGHKPTQDFIDDLYSLSTVDKLNSLGLRYSKKWINREIDGITDRFNHYEYYHHHDNKKILASIETLRSYYNKFEFELSVKSQKNILHLVNQAVINYSNECNHPRRIEVLSEFMPIKEYIDQLPDKVRTDFKIALLDDLSSYYLDPVEVIKQASVYGFDLRDNPNEQRMLENRFKGRNDNFSLEEDRKNFEHGKKLVGIGFTLNDETIQNVYNHYLNDGITVSIGHHCYTKMPVLDRFKEFYNLTGVLPDKKIIDEFYNSCISGIFQIYEAYSGRPIRPNVNAINQVLELTNMMPSRNILEAVSKHLQSK